MLLEGLPQVSQRQTKRKGCVADQDRCDDGTLVRVQSGA